MRMPRRARRGQEASYHCMSRTVAGQSLFGSAEREFFRTLLRKLALFCQVVVIDFTCLSNHFHVIVQIPAQVQMDDHQLLASLERFYGPEHAKTLAFAKALVDPDTSLLEQLRHGYLKRMGDLSIFFKELKERFSKWFNRVHERFGTLWAERFKSVFIANDTTVILNVAMYVDLNACRAGMSPRPEEYPHGALWEALERDGPARQAFAKLLPGTTWEEKWAWYQQRLYARGACPTKSGQAALDPEEVYKVFQAGGKLTFAEMLHLKVVAFTEGIAIGRQGFLDEIAELHRTARRAGHAMPGVEEDGILSFKKIKVPVMIPVPRK